MHGRRGRQRDLGRDLGHVPQEFIFIERKRLPPDNLCERIRRGERHLVTGIITEFERGRLDLEAFRALDEATPIGAAAEFAVGHHLQSGLLLQRHHVADALILQRREVSIAQLACGVPAEGLPQGSRAQQAADVIGAERRAALGGREHGFPGLSSVATIP